MQRSSSVSYSVRRTRLVRFIDAIGCLIAVVSALEIGFLYTMPQPYVWESSAVDSVHVLLVELQNLWHQHRTPKAIPPSRKLLDGHCSDILSNVHLATSVMSDSAFARVKKALTSAGEHARLCYKTPGRQSCVLTAAQTTSAARDLQAWYHDPVWAARLSSLAGEPLYPLDERRFRMAFTTHQYREGSFNAPHRDSARTDSKVWTVILGVANNSTSHLVVEGLSGEGEECTVEDNAALIFEGGERLHWVPTLIGGAVRRTIVFLEYTVLPADEVKWSWPWSKMIVNAERIFLQ